MNLDETRECYLEAEDEQQKQLDEAVRDRDAVSWAISKDLEQLNRYKKSDYNSFLQQAGFEVLSVQNIYEIDGDVFQNEPQDINEKFSGYLDEDLRASHLSIAAKKM